MNDQARGIKQITYRSSLPAAARWRSSGLAARSRFPTR
jgi:hypothetical protein